jgi:plasmid stabilization system protein ParE
MNIIWHCEAVIEYDNMLAQAQARNFQEAKYITAHVEQALTTLQQFPQSGRFLQSRGCYEKYVPRTRIKFIYRFTDAELTIIATFHTSRNPHTKPFARLDVAS